MGKSYVTQLITCSTINDFVKTLNRLGQIDAIFLYTSKAFCTFKWIKDLLTGRTQQVVVNGKYSDLT